MVRSILVVDDDPTVLRGLKDLLASSGYDVQTVRGGQPAIERLTEASFDLLITDLAMPEVDGFTVMKYALRHNRARWVIIITGEGSIPVAVDAIRLGASDFVAKPLTEQTLLAAVQRVLGEGVGSVDALRPWREKFAPNFIGASIETLRLLEMVQRVASTECDVLITGQSGTGKELVAKSLHAASRRCEKPFVAINCAAIPKELIESEIFGHAKGAFTGANERREGKFQAADGGTLFLDEIGEMDITLQGKLLRVIQEKEFTPVGETRARRVDVRIISATNQDLEARCREKIFREDLFYRLNVIPITVPPLRDRRSDIPLLVDYFIDKANRRHGRRVSGIDREALDLLCHYDWPGNVRELSHLIERVVVLKIDQGPITKEELPSQIHQGRTVSVTPIVLPEGGLDINQELARVEIRLTVEALTRAGGNKARAAELLGLKRTTLVERLKKLNIADAI